MSNRQKRSATAGFTIIELMVVVGIIALLVSILLPVIGKVRRNAHAANTKTFLNQLASSIERYQGDFRAYPGPISNDTIYDVNFIQTNAVFAALPNTAPIAKTPRIAGYVQTFDSRQITGTENLVLGLLGGLVLNTATNPPTQIFYDPSLVGAGPKSLNPANPKSFSPYMDAIQLSTHINADGEKTGRYTDQACPAILDTEIPEFIDNFPDAMPVLYLRAKPGVPIIATNVTIPKAYANDYNSVMTNDPNKGTDLRVGSYDISQIIAYTASYKVAGMPPVATMDTMSTGSAHTDPADYPQCVGEGKRPPQYYISNEVKNIGDTGTLLPYHGLRTVDFQAVGAPGATYQYPLDAYPYFQNPASPATARQKDSYILISAGIDRIYGTADDIVSFGSVGE